MPMSLRNPFREVECREEATVMVYPFSFRAARVSFTCGNSPGTSFFRFRSKISRYVAAAVAISAGVSPG